MDRTDSILRLITETIYEEEGLFYVTVIGEESNLPLEGTQRLVFGGKATPNLRITERGIAASLSINRIHYDADIPWGIIFSVEGADKAFYCRRRNKKPPEDIKLADSGSKKEKPSRKNSHLKVVK